MFGDLWALTYQDPDHSIEEPRFITVGMSSVGRLLIAAHAVRGEGIRTTSARKTTVRERMDYEQES